MYHLACSRSRCVITLALLVSGCICSSHASHVGATLGQLYVDESRVGLDATGVHITWIRDPATAMMIVLGAVAGRCLGTFAAGGDVFALEFSVVVGWRIITFSVEMLSSVGWLYTVGLFPGCICCVHDLQLPLPLHLSGLSLRYGHAASFPAVWAIAVFPTS